jgi:hypothetical protein
MKLSSLIGLFCFVSRLSSAAFIEERTPRVWDRGCEDWPQVVNPEFGSLQPNPSTRTEKKQGFFRVYSQMHIDPRPGESTRSLVERVDSGLSKVDDLEKWVLPGINEKAGGGRYFVSVDSLSWEARARNLFIISGPYSFGVLGFRRQGYSSLWYRYDSAQKSLCPSLVSELGGGLRHVYRMTPHPDMLKMLIAEVWVLAVNNRAELRLRVAAQPAPLVYELLPELLVRHELQMRGNRIFENFVQHLKNLDSRSEGSSDKK